jgi:hypothetical protein
VAKAKWQDLEWQKQNGQKPVWQKQNFPFTELERWVLKFQGLEKVVVKFFLAYVFWSLWKTKKGACFDNFLLHDPCDISYQICHWIDFWSEL